jgi:hypothetical protein
MSFSATFNNISVIGLHLLVKETDVLAENMQQVAYKRYHIILHLPMGGFWTHNYSGDRHGLHR